MTNQSDELEGFSASSAEADAALDSALEERMFKLRKKLDPDQVDELDAMGEKELRARISQCECNILESDKAKIADKELRTLKDKVKDLAAPYNEVKKTQRALAEYAACLLDKKGLA